MRSVNLISFHAFVHAGGHSEGEGGQREEGEHIENIVNQAITWVATTASLQYNCIAQLE